MLPKPAIAAANRRLNRSGRSSDKSEVSDTAQPIATVMNSATTLPDSASDSIRAPRLLGLYLLLIMIAAIEAFEGLSHAQYYRDINAPETIDYNTEIARFFDKHLGR